MSRSFIPIALAAGVASSLFAAPPALARGMVFGGSTSNEQAIVLRADAKAQKLKSAVIAWEATCQGDRGYADSADVTAVAADAGFQPGGDDLALSRNARGRFTGMQLRTESLGDLSAGILVQMSGRMRAKRASGTMSADVVVLDATGAVQDRCTTGPVRWSATSAPGRVFGGVTSQVEPVVVRLDRSGRRVDDFMLGWGSETCVPDGYINFGDSLTNFPLKSGRFGDSFSEPYKLDDGSTRTFAYDIAGRVSRSEAHGSFHVTVKEVDPAGAESMSCDTGAISWRALTSGSKTASRSRRASGQRAIAAASGPVDRIAAMSRARSGVRPPSIHRPEEPSTPSGFSW